MWTHSGHRRTQPLGAERVHFLTESRDRRCGVNARSGWPARRLVRGLERVGLRLNGVPNTANPFTLTTILRDEWGFTGTTISDYQATQELEDFGYAANGAQAAQLALTAGVNIEMAVTLTATPVNSTYATYGPALLSSGKITMVRLNDAVRHVLTLKYLAGMFSNPFPGNQTPFSSSELTPAHLAAARTMADESMVLLNNNNHALPLSTSTSKVAVVGPLADDPSDQLGPDVPIGYDLTPADLKTKDAIVSVLGGIQAAAPNASVTYAQGCDTTCTDTSGFGAAVADAQAADVTVVVVGEPSSDTGEASSRTMLGLPGNQLQLVQQIAATGKPYVVVLMNGRPLTIPWLADNAPGLLESWYPGTEGGNAVADLLFGKVDPSGKLTMSFPANVGQIPISYNELPTGRPYSATNKYTSKYLDAPNTPQYQPGHRRDRPSPAGARPVDDHGRNRRRARRRRAAAAFRRRPGVVGGPGVPGSRADVDRVGRCAAPARRRAARAARRRLRAPPQGGSCAQRGRTDPPPYARRRTAERPPSPAHPLGTVEGAQVRGHLDAYV